MLSFADIVALAPSVVVLAGAVGALTVWFKNLQEIRIKSAELRRLQREEETRRHVDNQLVRPATTEEVERYAPTHKPSTPINRHALLLVGLLGVGAAYAILPRSSPTTAIEAIIIAVSLLSAAAVGAIVPLAALRRANSGTPEPRRHESRFDVPVHVTHLHDNGHPFVGTLIDISTEGLACQLSTHGPTMDDPVVVHLDIESGIEDDLLLRFMCRVVWAHPTRNGVILGMEFPEITKVGRRRAAARVAKLQREGLISTQPLANR